MQVRESCINSLKVDPFQASYNGKVLSLHTVNVPNLLVEGELAKVVPRCEPLNDRLLVCGKSSCRALCYKQYAGSKITALADKITRKKDGPVKDL